MKIFELSDDQPIVTTEGIMLFKELYDRDTQKGKDRFFQEMQYVYFLTDYKSLYYSFFDKPITFLFEDQLNLLNFRIKIRVISI